MSGRGSRSPDAPEEAAARALGRAIRVLRAGRDLSRRDLSRHARVSYSYLSEIENGEKSPSSRVLGRLAGALGLAAYELLEAAERWQGAGSDELLDRTLALGSTGAAELRGTAEPTAAGPGMSAPAERPASRPGVTPERDDGEAALDALSRPDLAKRREPRVAAGRSMLGAMAAFRSRRTPALAPPVQRGNAVPAALLDEIQAGNCVAFVGAGFSAAARLPAWGDLLRRVAARSGVAPETQSHVAERVERGSSAALDEAAQVLEDELGREALLDQLEALLGQPTMTPEMERRLAWLCGTPFRSILTTNFDGVLQGVTPSHDAYRSALRPERYRWWEPRYWEQGAGAFTLKLHGDLRRTQQPEDGVVLTRRDYRRRLYQDPAYAAFLRAVMATTTVLYLGFSFEDAYLNELRSEILALLGQRRESAPVAYAIVNDVPTDTRRHFRRHEGIEILSYDTRGRRDFSGFDAYLERIHAATNPLLRFARHLSRRRILWVDPHPENNGLAFAKLAEAARASGREGTALVTVATADEGLRQLEGARADAPFDLAITHWGAGAARDGDRRKAPAAVHLLTGIRARDLRCPVVVFAAATDAEQRKRTALGLGAQAYCFNFETLYRSIERVLAPAEETG